MPARERRAGAGTMNERIEAEAARWYAAQDSDAMDWEGFTAWLEADPRHRAAFDQIALLGDALDRGRGVIAAHLPANEDAPPAPAARSRWRWWGLAGGGAAAAALALVVAVPREPATTIYATAAGQTRVVALADGSRVTVAPASQLTISGRGQDRLALEGAAYFDVPHRPGRTLTVEVGGLEVRDIGTRFAITSGNGFARIEVAEGRLAIASNRLARPVELAAGGYADADLAAGRVRLGAIAPASVASWRSGQLRYADAPLALVAADIARYVGKPVDVDPALRTRRFSGVLRISEGSKLATSLGAIMAIDVVEDGRTIHLRVRS